MARKLTFLLKQRTGWRLAFKSALVSSALFLVYFFGASFVTLLIFVAASFWTYAASLPDKKNFQISFFISYVLGFAGAIFIDGPIFFLAGLLVFAAVIFGLEGAATLFFKDRVRVYEFLSTAIVLGCFLFAFELGIYQDSLKLIAPILFLFVFGLVSEFLAVSGVAYGKRGLVLSAALALIASELAFLLSFLPLGTVNAAAFAALLFIIAREGLSAYFRGAFNLRLGLRLLVFLLFFVVLISASSGWSL